MTDVCKIVRIVASHPESQGEFVEINVEDFDSAIHVPFDRLDHDGDGHKGGSEPDDGLTKAELCADLEAMGVDFDPRAKKADLQALRDEARAIRDA